MKKISLLGPTFSTNNLGVNALTLGTIQSILMQNPKSDIVLIDYNKQQEIYYDVMISNEFFKIKQLNMRFSKLIFQKYHILRLMFTTILLNIFNFTTLKNKILSNNKILHQLSQSELICAVCGGDSFSDIYGLRRFIYIVLPQFLAILLKKKLILLPQTLGPFKSPLSKQIVKFIFKKALVVYSRDKHSLDEVQKDFSNIYDMTKFKFCYDLGFVIDAHKMENNDTKLILSEQNKYKFVGINISGLLYIGGYTKENMFGLNLNYQELIKKVINHVITNMGLKVILVPHVLGKGHNIESDDSAISLIYNDMCKTFPEDIITLSADYDQNQIKYIISMCDIFIGSRMHSCIAAISQSVPAVSLAYSKKFIGVMQSVGLSKLVADLRKLTIEQIISIINTTYDERNTIKDELNEIMPKVDSYIRKEFKYILTI